MQLTPNGDRLVTSKAERTLPITKVMRKVWEKDKLAADYAPE